MAADNLSNISGALATTFAPQLVRAWNRASVFLSALTFMPGGGQGGGKQLGWDVQFSGASAASFAEGSDVDSSEMSHDVEKSATIAWGQYRSTFQLSNLELNAAYANMGNAAELERILEERFFDACAVITSKMNKDAIAGTGVDGSGNPTLVGILTALDATTTYGTLNKITYPEWAGNVVANGSVARPLTLDLLAKADQAQYVASGYSCEMILTTPGVKTKYEGLFNPLQRVNTGGGPIPRFDGSSDDLFWRGRPIVRDKDMTAGYMAGIVASEIELRVLPWVPVPDMVPMTVRELVSSNGGQAQNLGAFVHVYPLARTGSAVKFCAEIYAQIKVKRPNQHFLLADISET